MSRGALALSYHLVGSVNVAVLKQLLEVSTTLAFPLRLQQVVFVILIFYVWLLGFMSIVVVSQVVRTARKCSRAFNARWVIILVVDRSHVFDSLVLLLRLGELNA